MGRVYGVDPSPLVVRSTLIEGSVPPNASRTRQEPVFSTTPEEEWRKIQILKPLFTDPAEKISAELVIDSFIFVGSPGNFVRAKILVDSGSRVPILFRRNFIQNLQPAKNPIKMCTVSHQPLPGGSMGAVFSMALPIALPDPTGKLVEQKFGLQEWGYEGAIGGRGLDILLGYPILVRYGIAILPRFDGLEPDSQQHGSGLLPPSEPVALLL